MENYIVKRDGQRDLKFTGEIIGAASSRWLAGKEQNRWTEVKIYKTQSGKFVVETINYTQWQGELNNYRAEICDNPLQAMEELSYTEDGSFYFSGVGKEALEEAIKEVPELAAALYEEI